MQSTVARVRLTAQARMGSYEVGESIVHSRHLVRSLSQRVTFDRRESPVPIQDATARDIRCVGHATAAGCV